jgi:hypothetical protein
MSYLIDGNTGEVIGPLPNKAKQAKPTFEGESVKQGVIRTRVTRRYRIPETPAAPITNRNLPDPTPEQLTRFLNRTMKMARRYNRQMSKTNPVLGVLGEMLLDRFQDHFPPPPPPPPRRKR